MKSLLPKTVSVAVLADLLGMEDTRARNGLKVLGMKAVGEIPLIKSARALCQKKEGAETKAALADIELEKAKRELERSEGQFCYLSDAKLFWSEYRIAYRQLIERADYLSETAKKRLMLAMAAVKIKPPEGCE